MKNNICPPKNGGNGGSRNSQLLSTVTSQPPFSARVLGSIQQPGPSRSLPQASSQRQNSPQGRQSSPPGTPFPAQLSPIGQNGRPQRPVTCPSAPRSNQPLVMPCGGLGNNSRLSQQGQKTIPSPPGNNGEIKAQPMRPSFQGKLTVPVNGERVVIGTPVAVGTVVKCEQPGGNIMLQRSSITERLSETKPLQRQDTPFPENLSLINGEARGDRDKRRSRQNETQIELNECSKSLQIPNVGGIVIHPGTPTTIEVRSQSSAPQPNSRHDQNNQIAGQECKEFNKIDAINQTNYSFIQSAQSAQCYKENNFPPMQQQQYTSQPKQQSQQLPRDVFRESQQQCPLQPERDLQSFSQRTNFEQPKQQPYIQKPQQEQRELYPTPCYGPPIMQQNFPSQPQTEKNKLSSGPNFAPKYEQQKCPLPLQQGKPQSTPTANFEPPVQQSRPQQCHQDNGQLQSRDNFGPPTQQQQYPKEPQRDQNQSKSRVANGPLIQEQPCTSQSQQKQNQFCVGANTGPEIQKQSSPTELKNKQNQSSMNTYFGLPVQKKPYLPQTQQEKSQLSPNNFDASMKEQQCPPQNQSKQSQPSESVNCGPVMHSQQSQQEKRKLSQETQQGQNKPLENRNSFCPPVQEQPSPQQPKNDQKPMPDFLAPLQNQSCPSQPQVQLQPNNNNFGSLAKKQPSPLQLQQEIRQSINNPNCGPQMQQLHSSSNVQGSSKQPEKSELLSQSYSCSLQEQSRSSLNYNGNLQKLQPQESKSPGYNCCVPVQQQQQPPRAPSFNENFSSSQQQQQQQKQTQRISVTPGNGDCCLPEKQQPIPNGSSSRNECCLQTQPSMPATNNNNNMPEKKWQMTQSQEYNGNSPIQQNMFPPQPINSQTFSSRSPCQQIPESTMNGYPSIQQDQSFKQQPQYTGGYQEEERLLNNYIQPVNTQNLQQISSSTQHQLRQGLPEYDCCSPLQDQPQMQQQQNPQGYQGEQQPASREYNYNELMKQQLYPSPSQNQQLASSPFQSQQRLSLQQYNCCSTVQQEQLMQLQGNPDTPCENQAIAKLSAGYASYQPHQQEMQQELAPQQSTMQRMPQSYDCCQPLQDIDPLILLQRSENQIRPLPSGYDCGQLNQQEMQPEQDPQRSQIQTRSPSAIYDCCQPEQIMQSQTEPQIPEYQPNLLASDYVCRQPHQQEIQPQPFPQISQTISNSYPMIYDCCQPQQMETQQNFIPEKSNYTAGLSCSTERQYLSPMQLEPQLVHPQSQNQASQEYDFGCCQPIEVAVTTSLQYKNQQLMAQEMNYNYATNGNCGGETNTRLTYESGHGAGSHNQLPCFSNKYPSPQSDQQQYYSQQVQYQGEDNCCFAVPQSQSYEQGTANGVGLTLNTYATDNLNDSCNYHNAELNHDAIEQYEHSIRQELNDYYKCCNYDI